MLKNTNPKSLINLSQVALGRITCRFLATKPTQQIKKKERATQHEIVIPKRVPRAPTSILEALSSTVGYDPTGAPYRIVDDPVMIPATQFEERQFMLSEVSGKMTAESVLEQFPHLFRHGDAAPTIDAFNPKELVHKEDGEEALIERITLNKTTEAMAMYSRLAGTELSPLTKCLFLDLLCRTNCEDLQAFNAAKSYYLPGSISVSAWKGEPVIMQLFTELSETYPQTYISLIMGLIKYKVYDQAFKFYKQAEANSILLPIEVHNRILGCVISRKPDIESAFMEIKNTLLYLEENGIRPDLDTFNTILKQLSILPAFTDRLDRGLQVIMEMKSCGIGPSLGTYSYLLDLLYGGKKDVSNDGLRSVLKEVMGQGHQKFEVRHPSDLRFFKVALRAAESTNDMYSAHQLFSLVTKGHNSSLMENEPTYNNFFNAYFSMVIQSEPMAKIIRVYEELVPRFTSLHSETYKLLLNAVELYEYYQYLPKLYTDMKATKKFAQQGTLHKFTYILAKQQLSKEMSEEFSQIADDIYSSHIKDVASGFARPLYDLTSVVYSNFIQLALFNNDLEKAGIWFDKYKSLTECNIGRREGFVLADYCKELLSHGMEEQALLVLHKMQDMETVEDMKRVLRLSAEVKASKDFQEQAKILVARVSAKPKSSTRTDRSNEKNGKVPDWRNKKSSHNRRGITDADSWK